MRAPTRGAQPSTWTVQLTAEAQAWFKALDWRDAHKIEPALEALRHGGPPRRRPRVGPITTSRHRNMKELRSVGGHLRALVAFDPQRTAVVLIAGNKQHDWKGCYKRNIPVADNLYDRHLRSLGKEGLWRTRGPRTGEAARGQRPLNEDTLGLYRRLMEAETRLAEDPYLAALARDVAARGGHLEVLAIFPDESVTLLREPPDPADEPPGARG